MDAGDAPSTPYSPRVTRHARAGRRQPAVLVLAIVLLVVASLGAAAAALRPWDPNRSRRAEPTVLGAAATASPRRRRRPPRPPRRPTRTPSSRSSRPATCCRTSRCSPSARVRRRRLRLRAAARPAGPLGPGRRPRAVPPRGAVTPPGTAPSGYPLFGTPPAIAVRRCGRRAGTAARRRRTTPSTAASPASPRRSTRSTRRGSGTSGRPGAPASSRSRSCTTLDRAGRTITVAHVAATYGTNGMPVDADKPWSVNLIDVPAMVAQAAAARAAGADLVVASMHCCVEYQTDPDRRAGRDRPGASPTRACSTCVIGHHAHVPQPVAHLTGGPRGEGMWVAYGLGNYVSNQDGACCVDEHRLGDAAHGARVEAPARSRRRGARPGPRGSPGSSGRPSPSTGSAGTRCTRWWTSRTARAR